MRNATLSINPSIIYAARPLCNTIGNSITKHLLHSNNKVFCFVRQRFPVLTKSKLHLVYKL